MPKHFPTALSAPSTARDYPDGKQGDVLTVEFTVVGIPCLGLNGAARISSTARPSPFKSRRTTRPNPTACGMRSSAMAAGKAHAAVEDRWGLSWQITLRALIAAITDPDRAAAKRAFDAMMTIKKINIGAIEAARLGQNPPSN